MSPSREEPRTGGSRWRSLLTEQRNEASAGIDEADSLQILRTMNTEDAGVAEAVGIVLAEVARATDLVVDAFQGGGRLFYVLSAVVSASAEHDELSKAFDQPCAQLCDLGFGDLCQPLQ